ncbi:ABC transporter permease [Lactococcus fujiensis]|uniref:ABC transporter permease n=1 Tax=Lactococcus fujiensis TaxID=610251 RepID=UPI002092767A
MLSALALVPGRFATFVEPADKVFLLVKEIEFKKIFDSSHGQVSHFTILCCRASGLYFESPTWLAPWLADFVAYFTFINKSWIVLLSIPKLAEKWDIKLDNDD